MKAYLGIDTSCYTTSVALIDEEGNLLADERIMLEVRPGEKGLRQSEAVFQHIKNSGQIFQKIKKLVPGLNIAAVVASTKPRPVQTSYMPVFVVAQNIGKTISGVRNIPFYSTSHQENHMMAGIWSARGPYSNRFLAVHLSGGTTELLDVSTGEGVTDIQIIGGSSDISAGQFVDRVGVAMGLPFPSGVHIEKLAFKAITGKDKIKLPFSLNGLSASFSGPDSHARRLLEDGVDKKQLALAILDCISCVLVELIARACKQTGLHQVLLVGGVSSNSYIKNYLKENLNCELFFPDPEYCRDNAVGTALKALKMNTGL